MGKGGGFSVFVDVIVFKEGGGGAIGAIEFFVVYMTMLFWNHM